MKLLYILTLIPALALASNEAQIGCELVKAQAEVQATVLADPSAIALAGDPSVTATQSVAFGVSQSVSGLFRARDIRSAADSKCDALYAEANLDLYEHWAVLAANRKGDIAEQNALDESVALQKDYISTLTKLKEEGLVNLQNLNDAVSSYLNTEQRQALLAKNMSLEIIPPPDGDLTDLINQANGAEGISAKLSAKAQANAGWDLQMSTGIRTPIQGGAVQAFVSVSAKYSFGTRAANRAATIVGEKTAELLNAQNAGYNQTVQRNRIELLRLIEVEQKDQAAVNHEVNRINRLLQPLIGIDSLPAKTAITEIGIQLSILNASLAGSKARLQAYDVLLNRFTLTK